MGGQTEDEVKEGIIIKEHFSQTRFNKLNMYFLNIKPSQHFYVLCRSAHVGSIFSCIYEIYDYNKLFFKSTFSNLSCVILSM